MITREQARNRAVNEAVGWDDRQQLAGIWQDHAPLPEEGLSDRVYAALIAVAAWGAGQEFDNSLDDDAAW